MFDWIDKSLEAVLKLWERGKSLLWALGIICLVVWGIIGCAALLGLGEASATFHSANLWLLIGAAVFLILAGVKTFDERRPPSVHIVPNERQSFWTQSRQKDGTVITQITLRMSATNLTTGHVRLSDLRLVRPWTFAPVIEKLLMTKDPNPRINTFSHENPILERYPKCLA